MAALACETLATACKTVTRPNSVKENSPMKTFSSISIREAASSSSSESESINQMMISIMNGASKSSWPVLKIDDALREANIDVQEKQTDCIVSKAPNEKQKNIINSVERSDEKVNIVNGKAKQDNLKYKAVPHADESCIPENVKNALEFAGFDLNQILDMTNQARQSFAQTNIVSSNNEFKSLTKKIITTNSNNNSSTDTVDLEEGSKKDTSELVSISNLRGLDIKQNVKAQVTNQIEKPKASSCSSGLESENANHEHRKEVTILEIC